MAGSRQTVGPASEPVTVALLRELLRYPPTDQDAVISHLIAAARQATEQYTGRAWVTQTWEQAFDTWPTADGLVLVRPPLQAVTTVTTYAPAGGAGVALDPTAYAVDLWATPARLYLTGSPQALRAAAGLVVTFTAGYGDSTAVPPDVVDAIATLVLEGFQRRPPAVPEQAFAWPATVLDALRPYRVDYRPRLGLAPLGWACDA
jgi:uncharacterized phiE125 gp8 family phage protein